MHRIFRVIPKKEIFEEERQEVQSKRSSAGKISIKRQALFKRNHRRKSGKIKKLWKKFR